MNDEQFQRFMSEIRRIRICAVVLAAVAVVWFLCSVLGIPWQDHATFGPAIAVLFETQGDTDDNRMRSLGLVIYMTALIAQKRRSGGDDLLCALIEVSADGDRLTNRELVTLALSLLMAG